MTTPCTQVCIGQVQSGEPGFPIPQALSLVPEAVQRVIGSEAGFPFEVSLVGNRVLDRKTIEEDANHKYILEQRSVDVTLNPRFWKGTRFENKSKLPDDMKVTVMRTPIVPIVVWKRLQTAAHRRGKHASPSCSEDRLLEDAHSARQCFMDINHPASVQAIVAYLTGSLVVRDVCPGFPAFVSCARAQRTDRPSGDDSVRPMWEQITMIESVMPYKDDFLDMDRFLKVDELLAHLFQVVFSLDCAQRLFGYCHQNLDLDHLGFVPTGRPNTVLYYRCYGKFYRVPTYGRLMKIRPSLRESIQLSKHMCSAFDPNIREQCEISKDNSNFDLAILGRTLESHLSQTGKRPVSTNGSDAKQVVDNLLSSWSSCVRKAHSAASGGTEAFPEKKHDILGFEVVCPMSKSSAAVPSNQFNQPWFSRFEVNAQQIPADAMIYGRDWA